jgi:hypothetical protein
VSGPATAGLGAAAALALALGLAGGALAEPLRPNLPPAHRETRLEVTAPLCPSVPFDMAAFLSILQAEVRIVPYQVYLTPPGGTPRDEGSASLVLETVPCDPAATTVAAGYQAPHAGRRVRLQVDLADVADDVRARVLSLVLAELLRSGPNDSTASAAPAAPSTPSAPLVAPTTATRVERPEPVKPPGRLDTRVAVEARVYRSFDVPMLGGRIGLGGYLAHLPIRAVVDLLVLSGDSEVAFGSVETRAAVGAVGLAWTTGIGRAELALGPRLEAGWGWLSGHSGSASVRAGHIDAPLASLSLAGAMAVRMTRTFQPFIEVETGLTLAEVVGLSDGARTAGLAGPWAAARIGIAVGF